MLDAFPSRVQTLRLTHFRNYKQANLHLDGRSVVFAGPNGSGKTNLLEALSFLSPGRGLRRATYDDVSLALEKGGDGTWAIALTAETPFGDVDIGTGLQADRTGERARRIKIDREAVKTADVLTEYLRVLWLVPAMDGLFTGPAGDRRRFLDRLVLAIDPTHGRRVNDFDKAVRNRNRILDENFNQTAWLDAAENQVAELGIAISAARLEVVSLLLKEGDDGSFAQGHFPRFSLAMEGLVDEWTRDLSAVDAEDRYRLSLGENRYRDRAAGRTLDGPHRSDLLVRHREKDMPARLCSTGEQKALLIGVVLAHAKLVSHMSGMTPIVLLDEVAAHLDAFRRAALFDVLEALNCQAFMTGTDRALFSSLDERAQFFNVCDGEITLD